MAQLAEVRAYVDAVWTSEILVDRFVFSCVSSYSPSPFTEAREVKTFVKKTSSFESFSFIFPI